MPVFIKNNLIEKKVLQKHVFLIKKVETKVEIKLSKEPKSSILCSYLKPEDSTLQIAKRFQNEAQKVLAEGQSSKDQRVKVQRVKVQRVKGLKGQRVKGSKFKGSKFKGSKG